MLTWRLKSFNWWRINLWALLLSPNTASKSKKSCERERGRWDRREIEELREREWVGNWNGRGMGKRNRGMRVSVRARIYMGKGIKRERILLTGKAWFAFLARKTEIIEEESSLVNSSEKIFSLLNSPIKLI